MSNAPTQLAQSKLRQVLAYNERTGVFTWKRVNNYHSRLNGKEAGTIRRSQGKRYRWIGIDGKKFSAHRLVWFYYYGTWPQIIDHKNGNSLDNRISNLNDVDTFKNAQNHKVKIKPNGLPTGVRRTLYGRFVARITVNQCLIHLGVYDTIENAAKAYTSARKQSHYCPRESVYENL